jgi:cation diffusion facilitator family transporter
MKDIDYKKGEKITIACIIGNIVLSALKLAAGIIGGSKAMIADSLHSASDIVATSVVLVGTGCPKPADSEHPYGHARWGGGPIAAAFVGVSLIFAAFIIVNGIVESIVTKPRHATFLALAAAVVYIVVKRSCPHYVRAGKKIKSESSWRTPGITARRYSSMGRLSAFRRDSAAN